MHSSLMGIEIGGTKLQIVIGDAQGDIEESRRLEVDPAGGGQGIREQIEATIRDISGRTTLAAIGVGFGGPVDIATGRICCSHQIGGWSEFPLREWLSSLAGVPVVTENDANTAALGEAVKGAGAGLDPVFYVTMGSGVGGGLVTDGRIYHGAKPGESEIGHLRLDRSGVLVEERCSGWAVDRKIRALERTAPQSLLCQWMGTRPGGEARWLAKAADTGDVEALRILSETAEDLAFALSHVTHLFHPEVIILGGGLSLVGELLRAATESALREFTMEAFAPGPAIRLARLGEAAVPTGALLLAVSHAGPAL